MPSKKPTQKLRQHPLPLGRGGKWWHEQVRRNVRAIFDGLVRKGAAADRATMSRAYAFAIGSLVRYGYLKRTTKGLYVTEKGLGKSREKLRTPDAKKKHAAYERQLALVRKPRSRRNPDEPPSRYAEAQEMFPQDDEARNEYTVFLIDPMEAVEPYLRHTTGQAPSRSIALALEAYAARHPAELRAALRARQTGTPYVSPTPNVDRLSGRSTTRRSLPSLIPEPAAPPVGIRTGMRSMKPVSYEDEYGEYGGGMNEAMTAAGVEDSAAKAAKRRAARDLLNERRDVLSRQGMNKPLMMSTFDPGTGMTTWTLMIPIVKRRTGADVTVSRIRSEVDKGSDERTRTTQLTVQQIADTDILRDKFRDPKARLDEATRLYQVIHSRGGSTAAPSRLKGWTKTASDPSTRAAYYETQAPTAVAWAMANLGPDTQQGTEMPLPPQLMQQILRVGGTDVADKLAQRRQEGVEKREKQALRLAVRGRQMVDPEIQALPEEERTKRIGLVVAREMKARGFVTGKKADKKIARAEQALGISAFRAGDDDFELPRRRPAAAPSAPVPSFRAGDDDVELPRRKKPTQTNPSRRR